MTASQSAGAGAGPGPAAGRADDLAGAPDVEDLRRDVEETAEVAMERGRSFAAAARTHALSYAEDRKSEAARSVGDLAGSLRDTGKTFDDRPNLKAFFESAANGLDDLAGQIETRSMADFYQEAETFARRSPAVVAAATFAAGFLLARFVKAGAPRDAADRFRA